MTQTPDEEPIMRAAQISDCGRYRYFLTRIWDHRKPSLVWVMLNPSTADELADDPTIRRCIGYARRDGYGGIIVVNLFAFRATSPADMKQAIDPVGHENEAWLIKSFVYAQRTGAEVIAGWGTHGVYRDQDIEVAKLAESAGVELKCLGTTKNGSPIHPLYQKTSQAFQKLGKPAI